MNINFLPNADKAQVGHEKIIKYLLSESHPDGRAKAVFFIKSGFTVKQWDVLAESLRKHGIIYPVVKTVKSEYGVRYCIEGPIETPNGSNPNIRTVWIVEEVCTKPRLITAYPVRRKE